MWLWKGSIAPKRYKVESRPCASGGAEFLWTIFKAEDSQGEGTESSKDCALFVCDKNLLAKRIPDAASRESTLNSLRESIKKLAAIRHPNVLRIKELIPESRSALAFIAEGVFLSLANARKEFVGLENEDITEEMRTLSLSHFEIACGMLQVSKAVEFLHQNGMVHGNISPYTIFICNDGHWKIADFFFLKKIPATGVQEFTCEALQQFQPYETIPQYPPVPSLYHCAPEMKQTPHIYNSKADMWSIGTVIFELYADRPLIEGGGSEARFRRTLRDWHNLTVSACDMDGALYTHGNTFSEALRRTLVVMLQINMVNRPTIQQFLKSPFFQQESPLKTLQVVEGILEISDIREQAKVLGSLPPAVEQLPKKIQRDLVLPTMLTLARNPQLGPHCLSVLITIANKLNQAEFAKLLEPDFAKTMAVGTKSSPQMQLQLARHASELVKLADSSFVENSVIPMISNVLQSNVPQILTAILKDLVQVVHHLKGRFGAQHVEKVVNVTILPRLKNVLVATTQQPVRIHGLIALASLIGSGNVERETLDAHVFPALRECVKADRSAGTVMCLLGVLEVSSKVASAAQLSKSVIPMTIALSGETCLNKTQFTTFMDKAQEMLSLLKTYRLEELGGAAAGGSDGSASVVSTNSLSTNSSGFAHPVSSLSSSDASAWPDLNPPSQSGTLQPSLSASTSFALPSPANSTPVIPMQPLQPQLSGSTFQQTPRVQQSQRGQDPMDAFASLSMSTQSPYSSSTAPGSGILQPNQQQQTHGQVNPLFLYPGATGQAKTTSHQTSKTADEFDFLS